MSKDLCIDDHVSNAVLSVLRYYSLFKYPLKSNEIYGNMPVKCDLPILLSVLNEMTDQKQIYSHETFYSLNEHIEREVERRVEANRLAIIKKKQAIIAGNLIYKFPFVRFAGISGSISKGYADNTSDLDFFIITAKNRLWICRTLLHLFKKLTYIKGLQHNYCMNYFIDLDHLELEEKNRFTAVEISSLIPVAGQEAYQDFLTENKWVNDLLPNGYQRFDKIKFEVNDRNIGIKTLLELLINIAAPEKINKLLMKWTDQRWQMKWKKRNFPAEEYSLAFKTTIHVSKNHPANHQKKVLEELKKLDKKALVK